MKKLALMASAASLIVSSAAFAKEYPIGKPVEAGKMEIAAVYLQPVTMSPRGMMNPASKSDIHLEADIHATAGNKNGFAEGSWIPSLNVAYKLTKTSGANKGSIIKGMLMQMVAADGPHYGDNIKLLGKGKYDLEFTVSHPGPSFGRHTDKESGVAPWFKTIKAKYQFTYAGIGKKGGY